MKKDEENMRRNEDQKMKVGILNQSAIWLVCVATRGHENRNQCQLAGCWQYIVVKCWLAGSVGW